jgi:hypothetical protein
MDKRKREDSDNKKKLEAGEEIEELDEAIEEIMHIEDEEIGGSSEGEGDDLMGENMDE